MSQDSETNNKPVQLHVMHSWGGGIERWVRDYCRTDTQRTNLILKSLGIPGIPGQRLALYQHVDDDTPTRVWELTVPIHATSITNQDYHYLLDEIIEDFNISAILVSSFIGHSLDILNTTLETIIVCHDYYPFCPAINIYFGNVCSECKLSHLQRCFKENKQNNSFPWASASEWIPIRKSFLELILHHKIPLIAPSHSVYHHLVKLDPSFQDIPFQVIPHGIDSSTHQIDIQKDQGKEKIRILLLGRLALHKGLELFKETYKEILDFADIFLLGCGETGLLFKGVPGLHITENYSLEDLPTLLENISPDLGLLLSIWPETFSYTLSELLDLKISPLVMKVGSFEERIQEGINGFLVAPEKDALIKKIRELSEQRHLLAKVTNYLKDTSHRTLQEMVEEYHEVVTLAHPPQSKASRELNALNLEPSELERSHSQILKTQTELERTQSQLQQTQTKLDHSQSQLQQNQTQLQSTQSQLQSTQSQLQSTQSQLQSTRTRLQSTQSELELSNTTIAAMETSKFWKMRTAWFKVKEPARRSFAQLGTKVGLKLQPVSLSARTYQLATTDSATREVSPPPPLTKHSASVDIIVCVHNALDDVKRCLESIIRYSRMPYTLIVVDDGSNEEICNYLAHLANSQAAIRIRNEVARGYTFAANQGLRQSQADYAILLNSDTIVTPGWLDRIVACGESDPRIGLIGPLSNTASWQSIPEIMHQGDWAENQLPEGMTVADMGRLVAQYSERLYPRIPFLNGFCLTIKRKMLEELGYFDEATFGGGYGEENDYCLRAYKAGWQLAVADDTYIYHSQSRSYSHDRRKALVGRSDKALVAKHGQQIISDNVNVCRFDRVLDGVRARNRVMSLRSSFIEEGKSRWEGKRVLVILPIMEPGGGGNVILQEAAAMQKMGVDVRVVNLSSHRAMFDRSYPNRELPVIYVDKEHHISGLMTKYDAVIATLYRSVDWMEPLTPNQDLPIRGYYIQDFEPYFFPKNSENFKTAWNSYTRYPDLVRITKTEWNCQRVKTQIGVDCSVIGPSLNLDLYRPRRRVDPDWPNRPLRIAAMIRPNTPRRQPEFTMKVLRELYGTHGNTIEFVLFGCGSDDPDFLALPHDFTWRNAGILTQPQLAFLLNETDIFVDFSSFQAMGLTAMEAMACGNAVIVPQKGGAETFARHEENSLVVDTSSPEACFQALNRLVLEESLRVQLQRQAIADICQYFPEKAAYNTLNALFPV